MLEDPTQQKSLALARGKKSQLPTSYDEATTPEQALAVAVILTAIDDLGSKNEWDRFWAHEFFLQPSGGSAEMRRFFFSAVNLDDEWVREHLERRLDPPERPARKWSYDELGDVIPRDHTFRTRDICNLTDLSHEQVHSRLQHLKRQGRLVQVQRGVYCHPDYEGAWRAQEAENRKPHMIEFHGFDAQPKSTIATPDAILQAMRDGRETVREIGFDVPVNHASLKNALDRLIERGDVVKDGPRYRIVQDPAA